MIEETSSYQLSPISNKGSHVSLVAPGDRICYSLPTYPVYVNKYGFKQNKDALRGTSQAAAYVTGKVAAYWLDHPELSNRELYQFIEKTAVSEDKESWSSGSGYGLIHLSGTVTDSHSAGGIYGQAVSDHYNVSEGRIRLNNGQETMSCQDKQKLNPMQTVWFLLKQINRI